MFSRIQCISVQQDSITIWRHLVPTSPRFLMSLALRPLASQTGGIKELDLTSLHFGLGSITFPLGAFDIFEYILSNCAFFYSTFPGSFPVPTGSHSCFSRSVWHCISALMPCLGHACPERQGDKAYLWLSGLTLLSPPSRSQWGAL